jgi:REP element-mobilizing transposase RayT
MVLAFHVMFGAYGFWLPNDPRGSWSDFVASFELDRAGPATKVTTRQSLAGQPHDHHLRLEAKKHLKFPPVPLDGLQARAVGEGFKQALEEGSYLLHACTILPEHVHLVIGRHARRFGQIVGHLKARATQRLFAENLWADQQRPVWAERFWKVFLDTPPAVQRAIEYVEQNPLKEGKPRQRWTFVVPYDDPI